MSYYNVPDDWGNYYSNCEYCGTRVHASEGGCDCNGHTNLPHLESSGYDYEDGEWSKVVSRKRHVARRNHVRKTAAWRPMKGDKYIVTYVRYIDDDTGCSRHEKHYQLVRK
tara:strand:- start:93 stop:425 length:333 start_codon:yes stop_codon:yes gene_type:complete